MWFKQRFNNLTAGVVSGLLIPVIGFFIFFLITRHSLTLGLYISKIAAAGNVTEIMSVSVFANILIFLLFNRFDMLRASKGVLAVTIIWALVVLGLKLL